MKGPLWDDFKERLHGRKIRREGKEGVVIGVLGDQLKVLWSENLASLDLEEFRTSQVEDSILDEFDSSIAFQDIITIQKTDWTVNEKGTQNGLAPAQVRVPDGVPIYSRKNYTWEELRIPMNGVQGLTKTIYPKEMCYTKGDLPLKHWANNPAIMDADIEFAVETIVDERIFKGKKQYLVKWKGYQLNPGSNDKKVTNPTLKEGDWLPEAELLEVAALDAWEKNKPQYYKDAQENALPNKRRASQEFHAAKIPRK